MTVKEGKNRVGKKGAGPSFCTLFVFPPKAKDIAPNSRLITVFWHHIFIY